MAFTNLKSEEEVKEYLKNLGTEYRFGCYSEKKPEVCHLLGDFLEAIKKDFCKAGKVYKANCDDHNFGKSCYKCATYIALGKGEPQPNYAVAMDYFDKACKLGEANACFQQGLMLVSNAEDYGLKKDVQKGVSLLEKACLAKFSLGCFYLTSIYINGIKRESKNSAVEKKDEAYEIAKDMEKAFRYASEGCHLGDMYSCANISRMYANGDGVKKDAELAEKYKEIALELQKDIQSSKSLTFQEGLQ